MSYSKYWVYKHQETYDNGVTWVDVTPSETVPSGSPLATYDTLAECEAHDYSLEYLTFVAEESGMYTFTPISSNTICYSLDDGLTWSTLSSGDSISVSSGDTVMWKGTLTPYSVGTLYGSGYFSSTNRFHVQGNAMSLLYGDNFVGETSLSGKSYAFDSLFNGCTHLTSAENLILPATTLASSCYSAMFSGCTSLSTVPSDLLPATTLHGAVYSWMFADCTSLTTTPSLPATTVTFMCYLGMFKGCTSLTTAPELPTTSFGDNVYYNQFCYSAMFKGCTSLTTAPELPSTALTQACYEAMFAYCTSLTTAPVLSATTLAPACYDEMFYGCTSLSSITCYARDISALNCTYEWVNGVASAGTFVKDCDTNWSSGQSGIPNGWNVTCPTPYSGQYLTFVAEESGTFQFTKSSGNTTDIQYSLDDGSTWSTLASDTNSPTIAAGQKILWKGTLTPIEYYHWAYPYGIGRFSSTGSFSVQGNIMSLLYGDNFDGQTSLSGKDWAFATLFMGCNGITSAENLILPATTLVNGCYIYMFNYCLNLTTAPELPATTLVDYCYRSMFESSKKLNYVKCLATNISASNCTTNWLNDVASAGTFVRDCNTQWSSGNSGIPSGWTVVDAT